MRERERESVSRGGAGREGDTESEAGSWLRAVSTEPDVGLKPTSWEITTWVEAQRFTDWVTQAPQNILLFEQLPHPQAEFILTDKSLIVMAVKNRFSEARRALL